MNRLSILWLLLVGSALVGAGRFLVPGHDLSWAGTYEAFTHIWVGVLLTLGLTRSGVRLESWVALGIITVLETILFLRR